MSSTLEPLRTTAKARTAAAPLLAPVLAAELASLLGPAGWLTDAASLALAAHDIFHDAPHQPLAVLRPSSVEALAQAVARLTAADIALAPRGGGMSYTAGYLPPVPRWVCVDTTRLNRVLEVNLPDLFITVQAGCTWAQVREALAGSGFTTPYGGPLSGLRATVGGALSQNSMFFGAGQHGAASESVLGLEIVLADGRCLATGSAALAAGNAGGSSTPFARWGGPDLTGAFLGDSGAFGIKATATLRLLAAPAEQGYASYGFPDIASMVNAQVALMRAGLGSECFGIDAYKAVNSAQTGNKLAQVTGGVKTLAQVTRAGGAKAGLLAGVKAAASVALAGTQYLGVHPYSIHLALDGDSPDHVAQRLARVAALCEAHAGTAQPASVPQVLRSMPFQPLRSVLGHDGSRWVPLHAILPLSRALDAVQACEALFSRHASAMQSLGVVYSPLTANLDRAFLYEPCFYWPDTIKPLHVDVLGPATTAPWIQRPAAPEALALVQRLWREAVDLLDGFGAVHFQVGRAYPYLGRLKPATAAWAKALKAELDPRGLMNPGALGL
ncbi:MAG: FAD-binding oxidoreductase [Betaproteobacteria bacterium]